MACAGFIEETRIFRYHKVIQWMEDSKYLEPNLFLPLRKWKSKPQNGRKCVQYIHLTMGCYPECVKNTKYTIKLKIR